MNHGAYSGALTDTPNTPHATHGPMLGINPEAGWMCCSEASVVESEPRMLGVDVDVCTIHLAW